MKNKIFSQQQQVMVLSVAALAGLVLFAMQRIIPLADRRARLQNETAELKARLAEMMTAISAAASGHGKQPTAIAAFSPARGGESAVVTATINKAAERTGVRVLTSKSRDPVNHGILRSFSVAVDANGDLVSIMRFAHELESHPSFFVESAMLQQKNWREKDLQAHFVVSRMAWAETIPVEAKFRTAGSASVPDFSAFAAIYNKRNWFYQLSDNDSQGKVETVASVDRKWAKLNDYLLVAVLLTDEPVAVVEKRSDRTPLFLKIKDRVDAMTVADIQKNKIVFEQEREKRELVFP